MRPTLFLPVLMLVGGLFAGAVRAASLEVSPVRVTLTQGETATTIEVTNHGDAPTAVQARLYRWTQAGDEDVLTPTADVIVSPPIFTLPDGGSQTMRLLLRGSNSASGERSYRLLLDEVPPANAGNRLIAFTLHMSLPVFVGAVLSARPTLQWRAERGAGRAITLTATNASPAYNKVSDIDVTLSDGSHPKVVPHATNPYVLSGDERHWLVQSHDNGPGGPLHLSVTSLTGKSELTLTP